MNHIAIYSRSGPNAGYGHKVRCERLSNALRDRGADVVLINHPEERTMEFSEKIIVDLLGTGKTKDLIIDLQENDDEFLRRLRPLARKLIVIVGIGHTITKETHWIADLVVYQAPFDCARGVPGENIVSGLEYIMIDPSYAVKEKVEKERDALVYFGGGVSDEYADEVCTKLRECGIASHRAFWGNKLWVDCLKTDLYASRLFVGSMGMTAYEAIACGVRPIVVCRSLDHVVSADAIEEDCGAINMGLIDQVSPIELATTVRFCVDEGATEIARAVDGLGVYRVAQRILEC